MAITANPALLTSQYQTGLNFLIDNFGEPIILHFEDTIVEPVNTSYDDVLRSDNLLKPSYKQTTASPAPVITQNTKTVTGIVNYKPKDFIDYGIRVDESQGILSVKTYLINVPDIERCKYIVPSSKTLSVINSKYILLRKPFPFGLGTDLYSICFFKLAI